MSNFYTDYTEQQYSLILEDTLEALTPRQKHERQSLHYD